MLFTQALLALFVAIVSVTLPIVTAFKGVLFVMRGDTDIARIYVYKTMTDLLVMVLVHTLVLPSWIEYMRSVM